MGYYTDYDASENSLEIQEAIEKISDYSGWHDGKLNDVKWYDHEEHCGEVSKMFPDQVIKLSGAGEESGDIWVKYFKNGKCQVAEAKITFEPFDESKLI